MQSVLFPTDFSAFSSKALPYAIELAKRKKARLDLLNVHDFPLIEPVNEESIAVKSSRECKRLREKVRYRLKQLVKREGLDNYPHRCFVRAGDPGNAILNLARQTEVELIVMGNRGKAGQKWLMGSNTIQTAREAPCPVLTIPLESRYQEVKYIAYATDLKLQDDEAIAQCREFAALFNARISFVHVGKEQPEKWQDNINLQKGEDALFIESDDVLKGLNEFAKKKKPDIIALTTYAGFWEKLFHKSITIEMILNSQIPLLVFSR